jgi:hypothetical protein
LRLRGDVCPGDFVVLFVDAVVDVFAFFFAEVLVDPSEGFVALPCFDVYCIKIIENFFPNLRIEVDCGVFRFLEYHPNFGTNLLVCEVEGCAKAVVRGVGQFAGDFGDGVVHVRAIPVLRSFRDGFLDEVAYFDGFQRDEPVEVGLRRFSDIVCNRAFQVALCGFEFAFDGGVEFLSRMEFVSREMSEIIEWELLFLVYAVLFELAAEFVFECSP